MLARTLRNPISRHTTEFTKAVVTKAVVTDLMPGWLAPTPVPDDSRPSHLGGGAQDWVIKRLKKIKNKKIKLKKKKKLN